MTNAERKPYREFITQRIEFALQQLDSNPLYLERCRRQNQSGEAVEELYHKLDKDERATIHRHYEGETVKQNFELDETYLQGMRDCIHILSFLDAFQMEVYLRE